MAATSTRNYTRLVSAIVIGAVVVGAAIITASYVGPTTTETRTSTSTTTNPFDQGEALIKIGEADLTVNTTAWTVVGTSFSPTASS